MKSHFQIAENQRKIVNWLKKISQNKTTDFQYIQDKLYKKLNKIMASDVTVSLNSTGGLCLSIMDYKRYWLMTVFLMVNIILLKIMTITDSKKKKKI